MPFIGGLGGEDLTVDMMYGAIQLIAEISENHETVWLTRE